MRFRKPHFSLSLSLSLCFLLCVLVPKCTETILVHYWALLSPAIIPYKKRQRQDEIHSVIESTRFFGTLCDIYKKHITCEAVPCLHTPAPHPLILEYFPFNLFQRNRKTWRTKMFSLFSSASSLNQHHFQLTKRWQQKKTALNCNTIKWKSGTGESESYKTQWSVIKLFTFILNFFILSFFVSFVGAFSFFLLLRSRISLNQKHLVRVIWFVYIMMRLSFPSSLDETFKFN